MATKNLIVRVGADLSDLEKATDKVKGHFAKLEQVRRSEAANRQDGLTQELDEANQKVQELKKQYRELVGGMGQADTEKGLLKQLREVEKARAELDKEYANKDESLKDDIPESVLQQYAALETRANNLYEKIKQIRLNPETTPEAQELARQLREAYKNAADLQKELNDANGDAAVAGVGKGTSLKAKFLDGLTAAGNGARAAVGSVVGGIGNIIIKGGQVTFGWLKNTAAKITNGVKNIGAGITRMASRITRLAASALVFNVLSQGFRSVQQGVAGMVESDSQLKASLAGIQGNLLTAFAPLWQTILPMVRAVTAALASLAGMITQVMAALFGTTTSAAQKSASAYYKQAAAAGSSTSASKKAREEAKKAKRDAADFDILHKVDKSTDSGGGSGGITPNFATNLSKTTPFADQLVQAIKDDDWYKVGSIFAEKLNDAMENIPWGKIRSTAHKWAQNIAETLNGFVETLDWGLVGNTLGNGLNTALDFLDTFAQNFHWDSLGQGIGNGLNQCVATLDWETVGRIFTDKLKALAETLHGLVQTFDFGALGDAFASATMAAINNINWPQAAKDLGTGVTGLAEGLARWIEGIDWGQIGKTVADCITGVDYIQIGKAILHLIGAAVTAAVDGVINFGLELANNFVHGLQQWFDNAQTQAEVAGYGDNVARYLFDGFIDGCEALWSGIKQWIHDHIFEPFKKGFCDLFGIHSPSTVMKELGGYTIQGFLNGITEAWETVTGWVGEHLSGLADSFASWKDNVGQTVSDWASGTKQSIQTWIGDTATNVGSWVSDRKQDFESWASTTGQTVSGWASSARQTIAGWGNDSKGSVVDFSSNARATLEAYSAMTQQTLNSWKAIAVGVFTTFGDNARDAVRGAVDAIGGTLQGMVSNAMNWGRDFIQNFIDGIKERMSGLLDSVKEMAERVSSYLHFSVPDTGPLADADTWMPDFMQLLAEGVEKNTPTLLNRVQNAARQISAAYNDLNAPAVAVAGSVTMRTDPMKRMDRGTDDMIATLRSGFNAVCKAVEDKDSSVYMDGDKVEDKTAKSRKKKARLYGHD
nr:MAG TPA: tail tape measure protein [Caudoviricetes sp.]